MDKNDALRRLASLTATEKVVLLLRLDGLSIKKIALERGRSVSTVSRQLTSIEKKLEIDGENDIEKFKVLINIYLPLVNEGALGEKNKVFADHEDESSPEENLPIEENEIDLVKQLFPEAQEENDETIEDEAIHQNDLRDEKLENEDASEHHQEQIEVDQQEIDIELNSDQDDESSASTSPFRNAEDFGRGVGQGWRNLLSWVRLLSIIILIGYGIFFVFNRFIAITNEENDDGIAQITEALNTAVDITQISGGTSQPNMAVTELIATQISEQKTLSASLPTSTKAPTRTTVPTSTPIPSNTNTPYPTPEIIVIDFPGVTIIITALKDSQAPAELSISTFIGGDFAFQNGVDDEFFEIQPVVPNVANSWTETSRHKSSWFIEKGNQVSILDNNENIEFWKIEEDYLPVSCWNEVTTYPFLIVQTFIGKRTSVEIRLGALEVGGIDEYGTAMNRFGGVWLATEKDSVNGKYLDNCSGDYLHKYDDRGIAIFLVIEGKYSVFQDKANSVDYLGGSIFVGKNSNEFILVDQSKEN